MHKVLFPYLGILAVIYSPSQGFLHRESRGAAAAVAPHYHSRAAGMSRACSLVFSGRMPRREYVRACLLS